MLPPFPAATTVARRSTSMSERVTVAVSAMVVLWREWLWGVVGSQGCLFVCHQFFVIKKNM